LTDLPHKDCNDKARRDIFKQLHYYKLHFLAPKAIATLMDHLMGILNKEGERLDKEGQMVELIIVLLK